jgi:RNA polymerase sigma-70 factor (ECF subfamily)
MKYEEVAEQLGISVNTVKNQMAKALKILKEGAYKVYLFFFQ